MSMSSVNVDPIATHQATGMAAAAAAHGWPAQNAELGEVSSAHVARVNEMTNTSSGTACQATRAQSSEPIPG
jgi:hypothetical protein